MTFTWLQWCAPELAREGLLVNESWVEKHSAEAVGMFGNQGLHTAATIMAAISPFAIDYIRQAPVLVLAGSQGGQLSRARERAWIAKRWAQVISDGPKLKDVLAQFELSPQHRKLRAGVLAPGKWDAVHGLSKIDASTLAQSIPERDQATWLRALTSWRDTMGRRYGNKEKHYTWAALTFGRSRGYFANASDLADFAGSQTVNFDVRWTLDQATAASVRWHTALQKMTSEQSFYERHGIRFSDPIDYGALPVKAEHNGLEIVAVQSGEDLYAEGVAMHHCVASYTREVVTGQSRIFSVRTGEKRHATFELTPRETGGWKLAQLKGPCNQRVTPSVDSAVQGFLKQLREARL